MKRSEEGSVPPQKKAKVDPKVASVKQTIEKADLPEPCKAMLVAMLPHSLCVPQDLRSEQQARAVDMVGEVFDSIELKLKNTADSESAKVVEIEASKDTVDAALVDAETLHSATTATVDSCKATLAQCFGTANVRKSEMAAAEESERAGNAPGLVVEVEHQELHCALEEHLKVLKEGSWETGSAKRHLDALLPLAVKHTDESLVTALPSTCIKAPDDRSTFDKMVIEQLESSLKSRLTQLIADIETAKPAKAERAEGVETARQMLKEAEDAQQKSSEETTIALAAQKDAFAALELARKDVATFKPMLRKAKEGADEAQAELELFHDNCRIGCFDMLKTKVSVVETPAPIVAESMAVEVQKGEDLISTVTATTDFTVGGC